MKPVTTPLASTLIMGALMLSMQGCSNTSTPPETTTEQSHEAQHAAGVAHDHPEEAPSEFIKMGAYQFKLSPEIMKDGETHLDFFVKNDETDHVKGVTGTFHITRPDGTKESVPVTEEAGTHYHGLLHLNEYGQYQVVAQLQIGEENFNPRFSFERKE